MVLVECVEGPLLNGAFKAIATGEVETEAESLHNFITMEHTYYNQQNIK